MSELSDEIWIARGKYSTLSGERRELLKHIQAELDALITYANRILRCSDPKDFQFAADSLEDAKRCVQSVEQNMHHLYELHSELGALKPLAWGKSQTEGD